MKRSKLVLIAVAAGTLFAPVRAEASPSYNRLAELLAKGYFKAYVPADASTAECVAFLNSRGVCFSLFDLMDPKAEVTREVFARAVGQSMLLFSGEAELEDGCIKLPLEAKTWVDYCLLNDIDFRQLWDKFLSSGR